MPKNIRLRVEVMAWVALAFWGQSIQIAAAQVPPEQNRKELMEALGPPFIVFKECNRASVSPKSFKRKSSSFARTTARSWKPSSPTSRKSNGMSCLARRSSWEFD